MILYLIIGLLAGLIAGFFIGKSISGNAQNDNSSILDDYKNQIREMEQKLTQLTEKSQTEIKALTEENGQLKGRIENSLKVFEEQKEELQKTKTEKDQLLTKYSQAEATLKALEQQLDEQKKQVEEINKKFQMEFENIANKILKQNTEEFVDTNRKKLDEILQPLKENIHRFEEKVEKKFIDETKQRSQLVEQLQALKTLNENLSKEASNLTEALKGSNKMQGNWGELILERILEDSGLIKDEEYFTQYTDKNQEDKQIKPDIVVKLPEDKHIIIDAKVSLIAYEKYVAAENEEEQKRYLKQHIESVKQHIKGLSEKDYFSAKNLNSPEFVLLFMPIESSFSIAIRADNELFQYAWDRKIIIVSPTTLLATLRTIASVWKHEKQTRNAIQIAEEAGKLYDKFYGFVSDLEKIEKNIDSAKKSYNDAFTKLKGRGGLISRTEKLKKMGAKANKSLPTNLLDEHTDED
ncbi:MAG TPA: DNA recombination protein RmuC [Flavobacteriales bacterium]|nr:DNA recombination protein RmuC [Flavobacteriales bacterium]|tara:strand:- start:120625 stop:122022 length:1398 start_codon:yes stop_codon:yes gene_type:complete